MDDAGGHDGAHLAQPGVVRDPDALGVASPGAELRQGHPFAPAPFVEHQQVPAWLHHVEAGDQVVPQQADGPHPGCGPAHGPHLALVEAQGLAVAGHDDELLVPLGEPGPLQGVVIPQGHGDEAAGPHVGEGRGLHPLDAPLPGEQGDVLRVLEVGHGEHGRHLFARLEVEHVGDVHPLGRAPPLGQLVDPAAVDPALVGEEEDVVQGAGEAQVDDLVLGPGGHALHAPAAPALGPEDLGRRALDVGAGAEADEHVLLVDQILFPEVPVRVGEDLRAPFVAELLLELQDLVPDQGPDLGRVGQQVLQVGDLGQDGLVFVLDLLPLQGRQPAQLQVQDGLGLDLAQAEAFHELGPGVVHVRAVADGLDHLVQELEGDAQAFQDVGPFPGLAQLELRAPGDDLHPVIDEDDDGLAQAQGGGLSVHQGQRVDPEGGLQRRVLEEPVLLLARGGSPLQLHHDAHPLAVALVPQVADLVQLAASGQLRDALQQGALVQLVGDLGDDDAEAAVAHLLDPGFGPDDELAPACGEGVADPLRAQDDAPGGEVRPLHHGHELVQADLVAPLPVVDDVGHRVGDLRQVVGRDVGGHAHRDAGAAVEQQVGDGRGQDLGLLEAVIEVGPPVHRIHVDVLEHELGQPGHAGLCVAHGRGAVPVDGAEVALAVHQGVAQAEVLGHAGHGVVDCAVPVRVVLAQHFTHDPGALLVGAGGPQAHVVHGVEDAPVHRLEAVPGIGQGPGHDDAHRVVQVGGPHLLVDGDGVHSAGELHLLAVASAIAREAILGGGIAVRLHVVTHTVRCSSLAGVLSAQDGRKMASARKAKNGIGSGEWERLARLC